MEPQTLSAYITKQIEQRVSKKDILEQLVSVGWSEDEASTAYAQALVDGGVPVPQKGTRGLFAKKSTTVEVVLNLFSFILLGIITTALGTLYFKIIEHFFPDPLAASGYYYSGASNAIHYAMAGLIIGFPLFVIALRLWFKKFREEENKVESNLTKWVTYLVLLIAAVVIVGDLITILYTFLQGEISIRFFLKGITVLVLAGSIFGFYFLERKKIQYRGDIARTSFQTFGWGLLGVIVVGIILGFVATGSPTSERNRTFDSRRSSDLDELAMCVNSFANQFERLPSNLSELDKNSSLSYCANRRDPETGAQYEYRVVVPLETKEGLSTGAFELCATFSLPSETQQTTRYMDTMGSKWYTHDIGKNCYQEEVSFRNTLVPASPEKF
ncbi:MAG: hypothetical protein UV60_C0003G0020 [Parcubacteria group bacterium GW2011_GWA2_43_11]|nr:MAG: hypothetical protein UU89_C0010G0020 [Parcubacteria group bacterium GW2011_GWC2_42_11]KKS86102.1 MAG: hypothetical protein UV60_C0003G0020 [Parcubacteria group bacterium GW2011_GWA2_43_11]